MNLKKTILMVSHPHQTMLLQTDGTKIISKQHVKTILNEACLNYGTTLEGTSQAIKHHLKIRQKCPICVSIKHHMIFFPIPFDDASSYLWVRYHPLMHAHAISSHQSVIQIGETIQFSIDGNIRMIKRQMRRCRTYIDILYTLDDEVSLYLSKGNQIDLKDYIQSSDISKLSKKGLACEKPFTH